MSTLNRLANVDNKYQGETPKVLCICSAGLLRSPTAAVVLAGEPWNYNTRAAGLSSEFALIVVDDVLLTWADLVVCMDQTQKEDITTRLKSLGADTPILSLDIPDNFSYRDPVLISMIGERFSKYQLQEVKP